MRVASIVSAALGVGPLLLGCGTSGGAAAPALGNATLPAPRAGRESRATFELPNGVAVVLEESHVTPTVGLQAWVRVGVADEGSDALSEDRAGLAHLVERVVLGGAKGAAVAAWSSHDATVFEALVAPSQAGAGLASLGAALSRQTFDATEIESARAEVLGELRRADVDPAARATHALFAAAFGAASYGRSPAGGERAVRALTPEQVARFHARGYVGPNITLVVVGDFDAPAVRAAAQSAFSAVPRGPAASAPRPAANPPAFPTARAFAGDAREGRIAVGFRLPAFGGLELAAVDLLAAVLARPSPSPEGEGRLPRELARNRQLAAATRASVFSGRAGGLLSLEARLPAGRAEDAARVILDEALRLAREDVPAAELEAARDAVEADLARGKETTSGYARKLGFFATVAGDADYEDRYLARLRAAEPADLRAVAARLLRADNLALVALAPDPSADGRATAALSDRLDRVARGAEARADARRAVAPVGDITAVDDVVRAVLPSGTRLLVLRDPAVHAVWVQALWPGGLRVEDAHSNGVTSLLAATLTRGTRTRSAARVAADARALGGSVSAKAGADDLGVSAEFLARSWEGGLELLADCLQNPAFAEAEVDLAQRAQLARARAVEDDVSEIAARLFADTLWPRHAYRWPLLGTAESISTLTRRRLVEHYRRFYGAAGLTVAIVGDVDVERVVAKARALFGAAPSPAAAPEAAPPALGAAPSPSAPQPASPASAASPAPVAEAPQPTEVFRPAPKEAAYAVLGYPGVSLRDPDRAAAAVLARLLSGPEGRLARETNGTVVAGVTSFSALDGGAFTVGVASAPSALDAAVPAVRAALGRVAAQGVSASELERAQREVVLAHVLEGEHRAATATALARGEALGLGAGALRAGPPGLGALTTDALARVARRLLDPGREIVAAVRPPAPAPAVAKASTPRPAAKPAQGGGRVSAP